MSAVADNSYPYRAGHRAAGGLGGRPGPGRTAGHQGWAALEDQGKVEVHLRLVPIHSFRAVMIRKRGQGRSVKKK